MPLTRNIGQYFDIREVLDAAAGSGGGLYTPIGESPFRWRARAYMFRTLLYERDEATDIPGYVPSTPYDRMKLTIEGPRVRIVVTPKLNGQFTGFADAPPEEEDELLTTAKELRKELEIE